MRMASEELALKHLWVIYPGSEAYALNKNVTVIPLTELNEIKF
jgi:hypothetical protein